MESLEENLDMLEDIIESAKCSIFSKKVLLDKKKLLDIIKNMRLAVPSEILHARRIVENHNRIINEANDFSKTVMLETEKKCERIARDHEVYKKATSQANELLDKAKTNANEIRASAISYADDILSKVETILKENMMCFSKENRIIEEHFSKLIEAIYRNRQELKSNDN